MNSKTLFDNGKVCPENRTIMQQNIFYHELKKLYKDTSFKVKIYNSIRYKTCPFEKIEKYVPKKGRILEIGSGYGIFSNFLALKSTDRFVKGVDIDRKRTEVSLKTIKDRINIEFKSADAKNMIVGKDNKSIVMVDVMYLLPYSSQEKLLINCFDNLLDGGCLVLKDMEMRFDWKFWWTILHEFLAVKVFNFTFGEGLYFRRKKDYLSLLSSIGFKVECIALSKNYFYPHILYLCKKKDKGAF